MKELVIALFLAMSLPLTAQTDARPQLDRDAPINAPALPELPPTPYPMVDIPIDSPKFSTVAEIIARKYRGTTPAVLAGKLKRGEKFLIEHPAPGAACSNCGGFGKIPDVKSESPDRKSPCSRCRGSGKFNPAPPLLIVWK